jgi:hypothetical protein
MTPTDTPSVYTLNKILLDLSAVEGHSADDAVFAGQRLDGKTFTGIRVRHSALANLSFLNATFADCHFENCVFIGCYFRKSNLSSCVFRGCRFIDCNFPKVIVSSCLFEYVTFVSCFIEPNEIRYSLPTAPNLRRDLTANLAQQAASAGRGLAARTFTLWSIAAEREHLRAAWRHESGYYVTHFPGFLRVTAFSQWCWNYVDGAVWGHGERVANLFATLLVMALLVFPSLFYLTRGGFEILPGWSNGFSWGALSFLSLGTMLNVGSVVPLRPLSFAARSWVAVEALVGIVLAGLFVAYVFRAITRR